MTNDSLPSVSDVRMRGFTHRVPVERALSWIDETVKQLPGESVRLDESCGRVLASKVTSLVDVPSFERAMMDGFAVRASDTSAVSPYHRVRLRVVGQAYPGQPYHETVQPGESIRIMTGSPVPAGADAVLPAEYAESTNNQLFALAELPPGKHVGRRGEDIKAGTCVLEPSRRLRPQDVGLLASIGQSLVNVVRRPRVRVVVTGNELLPPGSRPEGYRIVDSNSLMVSALVHRDGGAVVDRSIVSDDPESILAAMNDDVDIVLVSGGSSVGQEDHAPRLVAEHGELAIHGIAMRPSSPTGMGTLGDRLVFLLPGNPVSCLCAYDFFAGRAIRIAAGLEKDWPYRRVRLQLRRKIVSVVGRVDYARVAIVDQGVEPLAIAGASVLSSTTRADGFVIISAESEGMPDGENIEVLLYD